MLRYPPLCCCAILSRKVAAMSITFPPFSINSGIRRQSSSNFSGCSDAKVARPIPATARPAGLRPVMNSKAPAAKEPYIKTFFQSIFPSRRSTRSTLTAFLELNRALFVVQVHRTQIVFRQGELSLSKNFGTTQLFAHETSNRHDVFAE